MAVTLHAKSDSEVTSIDATSPPRSPRRPLYYVQSPSQHDVEKMSYGSSPLGSPHHYHSSPIHHSRESSTSRFSASLRNPRHPAAWKRLQRRLDDDDGGCGGADDGDDLDDDVDSGNHVKFYALCFVLSFLLLFTIFSSILWGASVPYKPKVLVKHMVFHTFNIQAGMDGTGVTTDMLTLNSTVKIFYRNPATFFGVHVTSTPLDLRYYQLQVASGEVNKFYQSRKSQRMVVAVVQGNQVPLYGGIPFLSGAKDHLETVSVPLNLTFVLRSRAYVLGRLVKPKFYRKIHCEVTLKYSRLGKPHNLANSCIYR